MRHSFTLYVLAALVSSTHAATKITIDKGPVNGVLIENEGHRLAIYGWKPDDLNGIEFVLLAHGRRIS